MAIFSTGGEAGDTKFHFLPEISLSPASPYMITNYPNTKNELLFYFPLTIFAILARCSGLVPQQLPTRRAPAAIQPGT